MSGSETGVMTSNSRVEPFGGGLQKSAITAPQPAIQSMRLAFSSDASAVYKPVSNNNTINNNNNNSPSFQPSLLTPSAGAGGGGGFVMEGSASGTLPSHGINMNAVGSGGEVVKRKRGRPRKYGPDGSVALALAPATKPVTQPPPPPQQQQPSGGGGGGSAVGDGGFLSPTSPPTAVAVSAAAGTTVASIASSGVTTVTPAAVPAPSSQNGTKKARGRPPGSRNRKQPVLSIGSTGCGFIPQIITVKAGEDVSSQIMAFSQHGPRAICVLSAIGAISNVTIRQESTTVTYEGRFDIITLHGSFKPFENVGQWSRTGGLTVLLSGSDGRILGGHVAGVLIAASPIQLVMGSFLADNEKHLKAYSYMEPLTATGRLNPAGGTTRPSSPPSRGTLSESSGGPGSPIHPNSGAYNSSNHQGISSMSWK